MRVWWPGGHYRALETFFGRFWPIFTEIRTYKKKLPLFCSRWSSNLTLNFCGHSTSTPIYDLCEFGGLAVTAGPWRLFFWPIFGRFSVKKVTVKKPLKSNRYIWNFENLNSGDPPDVGQMSQTPSETVSRLAQAHICLMFPYGSNISKYQQISANISKYQQNRNGPTLEPSLAKTAASYRQCRAGIANWVRTWDILKVWSPNSPWRPQTTPPTTMS